MLFALLAALSMACSKDENEQTDNGDPLIGVWHLRVIYTQDQGAVEVTGRECYQDSQLDVSATSLTLKLSWPNNQQGGCAVETQSSSWENEGGTYYLLQNGGREPLGAQLNDDNQTLQLNISTDGQPVSLIFRK